VAFAEPPWSCPTEASRTPNPPLAYLAREPQARPHPAWGFLNREDPMPWHRGYDPIQMVAIAVGVVIVVTFAFGL
jgi:hypothetical protein